METKRHTAKLDFRKVNEECKLLPLPKILFYFFPLASCDQNRYSMHFPLPTITVKQKKNSQSALKKKKRNNTSESKLSNGSDRPSTAARRRAKSFESEGELGRKWPDWFASVYWLFI